MPTSTRSTPRSSSATTQAARPAGRSSAAESCSPRATRRRPTASAPRWAAAGARLCPEAVVVPPRMAAYSEASKAVFEVFEDTTPLVEGMSIDEAFLDVGGFARLAGLARRHRGPAAQRHPRTGRAADHGRRRADEVPRQGRERRRETRRAARRATRRRTRLPPPAAGRAAVGRRCGHRRQAARPLASPPSATVARSPEAVWSRCSAGRRAGICTRLPQPRSAPGGVRAGAARSGHSARSAAPISPDAKSTQSLALVDRGPAACAGRPGMPHRGAAVAVRRFLPRDALAHARRARPRTPRRSSSRPGGCSPMPCRPSTRGITLVGLTVGQPRRRQRRAARAAVRPYAGGALDATLDDLRDRFGPAAVTRAALLGRDQGLTVPLLPD